jgi:hypothetical protein
LLDAQPHTAAVFILVTLLVTPLRLVDL